MRDSDVRISWICIALIILFGGVAFLKGMPATIGFPLAVVWVVSVPVCIACSIEPIRPGGGR